MKQFLIPVVILFSITTTIAFASANIAPQAKTLRKTYNNGNYSEVECENLVSSKGRFPCVFRTNEDSDLTTYSFDLYDYGYNHNFVTEEYTYWPSGHVLSFSVSCIDSDIQLLKNNYGLELTDMDKDFVECRIFLYSFARMLLAKRVEIHYYANGKYYDVHREIEGSNSKP